MASSSSENKSSTTSSRPSLSSADGQNQNAHTFTPFGAAFPSRRSSTPAASFIPPRFWQAAGYTQNIPNQNEQTATSSSSQQPPPLQRSSISSDTLTSGNKLHQSNSHSGETYQQHGFMNLPRRTSFGTVLGGNRLTAFTALGLGSGANSQGNSINRTSQQSNTSTDSVNSMGLKSKSSFGTLPGLQESAISTSADSTPAPSLPSSPVQKPQKTRTVFLPGPDGMCVENRARRKSEA
jgi:hypothetical protein